jgi:hypothetical protein
MLLKYPADMLRLGERALISIFRCAIYARHRWL